MTDKKQKAFVTEALTMLAAIVTLAVPAATTGSGERRSTRSSTTGAPEWARTPPAGSSTPRGAGIRHSAPCKLAPRAWLLI
jgi:hypothetical protein